MDERYLMHRLRATSWSAIIAAVLMSIWLLYQFFAHQQLRWDLLIIMAAMALTKLSLMVYYRRNY